MLSAGVPAVELQAIWVLDNGNILTADQSMCVDKCEYRFTSGLVSMQRVAAVCVLACLGYDQRPTAGSGSTHCCYEEQYNP